MLGNNIRQLRRDNDMSQDELAEKLGVTRQSISLWENGQTQPSLDNVIAISKIFDVSTDILLDSNSKPVLNKSVVHLTDNANETEKIEKQKKKNRKRVLFFSVLIVLIITGFVYQLFVFWDFSKDSRAMSNATESIVKVICYDHNGKESATGSGFFAYDDKTIVTNYHVISEAYSCKVSTEQDKTYTVSRIIAHCKEKDIVVMSLADNTGIKPLKFGNSNEIKKGENVVAVGSPLGIKNSVSSGVLSGRISVKNMDVLQFTAAISSGSSGGALFNNKGKVIGVTFASYEDGQSLNLAIPIAEVDWVHENVCVDLDVNFFYLKKHPYVLYLDQYTNYLEVSLEQLKKSPQVYDNKMVKVIATVSSTDSALLPSNLEYVCLPGYQTNSYKKDSTTDYNNDFENHPVLAVYGGEDTHMYTEFVSGDTVVIIGEFQYSPRHSREFNGQIFSYPNRAGITGNIVYKLQ